MFRRFAGPLFEFTLVGAGDEAHYGGWRTVVSNIYHQCFNRRDKQHDANCGH